MTDGAGAVVERTTYRPFGEEVRLAQPLTLAETKGFIGERFDDGAGLQYLNARYYDPRLAMFVQPDWWEVTQAGVGTNRYSYSFNDPVNGRDPGGHCAWDACVGEITIAEIAIGAIVSALAADHFVDASDGNVDGSSLFGNPVGVGTKGALEMVAGIGHNAESVQGATNSGLSSGIPAIDGVFGGFDNSKGRAGQTYPGTLGELNGKIKELAGATPGATHTPRPDGGTSTTFPDGTSIDTYPGRTKSGTSKPGFSITKPGQKQRNGIKGTIEGSATKNQDGSEATTEKGEDANNGKDDGDREDSRYGINADGGN